MTALALRHDPRTPCWTLARSIRIWALIVLAAVSLASHSTSAQSEPGATAVGAVYIVPITGTIDLGLAPYLSRVLDQAEAEGAAAGFLQIDTPGGGLDPVGQR